MSAMFRLAYGPGWIRFSAVVLSVGAVLASATQLRFAGVGPGEMLILAWLFASVVVGAVVRDADHLDAPDFVFLALLVLLVVTLCFGWVFSQLSGNHGVDSSYRTLAAVLFSTLMSITLIYGVRTYAEAERLAVGLSVCAAILIPGALVLNILGLLPLIDPWYFGFRLRGWSENPNQLALLLLPLPFFLVMRLSSQSGFAVRLLFVALLCSVLVLGFLTRSDALLVGWALALVFLCVVHWFLSLLQSRDSLRSAFVVAVLIPVCVFMLLLYIGDDLLELFLTWIEETYTLGGQGVGRLELWRNGYLAASEAPLLGYGPGAFAGYHRPFQGAEAHNTFIDIATNAGLIGAVAMVVMFAIPFLASVWNGRYAAAACVIALFFFASFHFAARHPLFWLSLVLSLKLGSAVSETRTRSPRGLAEAA